MLLQELLPVLTDNADRIRELAQHVSETQAGWKPSRDSWSLLEVIAHLYDEEREDFRVRLDIMLHQPEEPWPSIDPRGWVTTRKYNEWRLGETLDSFLEERAASLSWLRQLERPDWNQLYQAPFGPMRAGDMLTSWAAHDVLHMRQLVELHHAWLLRRTVPYSARYGGEW